MWHSRHNLYQRTAAGHVWTNQPLVEAPTAWLCLLQVCAGTQPFNVGPAMTAEQCHAAMAAGAHAVAVACQEMAGASAAATAQGAAAASECEASTAHSQTVAAEGGVATAQGEAAAGAARNEAGAADWQDSWGIVCVGELGIGNTTAAAALVAALCPDLTPLDVCGRGTGQSLLEHPLLFTLRLSVTSGHMLRLACAPPQDNPCMHAPALWEDQTPSPASTISCATRLNRCVPAHRLLVLVKLWHQHPAALPLLNVTRVSRRDT